MATAGDGLPRSSRRRTRGSISMRCTTAALADYKQTSVRLGYRSLSVWIRDLMESDDGTGPRLRRMTCGRLGGIGARLAVLADAKGMPDDAKEELRAIGASIVGLQNDMISRYHDAG